MLNEFLQIQFSHSSILCKAGTVRHLANRDESFRSRLSPGVAQNLVQSRASCDMTYSSDSYTVTILEVMESHILGKCMKEMSKNYSLEEREMAVRPVVANPPA